MTFGPKRTKEVAFLLAKLTLEKTFGSIRYVDFDTSKPTLETRADRCLVSHVVADTGTWEQKLAKTLEDMPEVIRYVKNQSLGFTIPYTVDGEPRN